MPRNRLFNNLVPRTSAFLCYYITYYGIFLHKYKNLYFLDDNTQYSVEFVYIIPVSS